MQNLSNVIIGTGNYDNVKSNSKAYYLTNNIIFYLKSKLF